MAQPPSSRPATLVRMDSQQVRDTFLEALAEIDDNDDGGLFALVVHQLTDAVRITERAGGEVKVDATALIEGALEAMAVTTGAWAADHGVTLQRAARIFLAGVRATET